jgi:replicative DNA helicase
MSSIREISESLLESKHHGIEEIFEDVFRDIEGKSNPGIPFGLTELDSYTDGVRPGELVVIAARASRGKTAMGLTIAEHMAIKRGVPLSFYSYEMSGKDILHRMLALATGYHLMKLRTGQYKADERVLRAVRGAAKGFKGRPFQLHDMRAVNKSIEHLCAHARCMKDKHGTAVIIIDYLQLIRAPRAAKENRQREVAEISASLRSLSAELDLTVIALAQLNREIESRGDGTPRLSDLRESGAIEQDADMVALLTRNDLPPDSKEKTADAMLYLAKQRNGPTGRIELGFQTESCRFVSKADIPIAAIEEARAQAEPDQEEMQFNQQTEEIEDGVPF